MRRPYWVQTGRKRWAYVNPDSFGTAGRVLGRIVRRGGSFHAFAGAWKSGPLRELDKAKAYVVEHCR